MLSPSKYLSLVIHMINENISVISVPDCSKCQTLKDYLKENHIPYTEKTLNSELQTDLIMNNIYFNPPILVIGDKYYSFKDFENKKGDLFDVCSCKVEG
jgi:glutaredoxin